MLPAGVVDAVGALSPFDPGAQLDASSAAVLEADRQLVSALRGLLASSRSPATARAYQSDWGRFASWCGQQGREPLPAEPLTLSLYLADAARTLDPDTGQPAYAAATLDRWVTAIGRAHTTSGCASPGADPLVRATVAGIHRVLGTTQHRKHPILLADLKALLGQLPATGWPSGAARRRDHALLLMGWAGAFRRSELAGLEVGDVVRHVEDGLHVTVRRSKTDQSGQGQVKPLPCSATPLTCPPCAYLRWRELLDVGDQAGPAAVRTYLEHEDGPRRGHACRSPTTVDPLTPIRPLFRPINRHGQIADRRITGAAVGEITKRYAGRAGLNPDLIGGHSLRAGFASQAGRNGASVNAIMAQTGHRSPAMVYTYLRRVNPLDDNAVSDVGA